MRRGMAMMKKYIYLPFVLLLLLLAADTALASGTPKRIAILPIMTNGTGIYEETEYALQDRLEQEFHVPLNGTLKAVELLPEKDCREALAAVDTELRQNQSGKRLHLEDEMKPLADKLQADIVVGLVVTNFWEYTHVNWEGDTWLESDVSLQLVGYNRAEDKVIHRSVSRSFHSEYALDGTASALAEDGLESLLREEKLHDLIFPLIKTT